MLKKLRSYMRFWNKKPSYHVEGSAYGGLRIDIDKYYSIEENVKELEEINESFGKIFKKNAQKEEHSMSI